MTTISDDDTATILNIHNKLTENVQRASNNDINDLYSTFQKHFDEDAIITLANTVFKKCNIENREKDIENITTTGIDTITELTSKEYVSNVKSAITKFEASYDTNIREISISLIYPNYNYIITYHSVSEYDLDKENIIDNGYIIRKSWLTLYPTPYSQYGTDMYVTTNIQLYDAIANVAISKDDLLSRLQTVRGLYVNGDFELELEIVNELRYIPYFFNLSGDPVFKFDNLYPQRAIAVTTLMLYELKKICRRYISTETADIFATMKRKYIDGDITAYCNAANLDINLVKCYGDGKSLQVRYYVGEITCPRCNTCMKDKFAFYCETCDLLQCGDCMMNDIAQVTQVAQVAQVTQDQDAQVTQVTQAA